jgi:hypothetical protein
MRNDLEAVSIGCSAQVSAWDELELPTGIVQSTPSLGVDLPHEMTLLGECVGHRSDCVTFAQTHQLTAMDGLGDSLDDVLVAEPGRIRADQAACDGEGTQLPSETLALLLEFPECDPVADPFEFTFGAQSKCIYQKDENDAPVVVANRD